MTGEKYTPRLKEKYLKEAVPQIMKNLKYDNPLQVPRMEAVVINIGVGEARDDKKVLDDACKHLAVISGQKPVITRARKSIAGFKIRKGIPIGCKVTLRRDHMYEFIDRFITFVLPRIRDFRGVKPNSFDGRGNYSMGIEELHVFPEIDPAQVSNVLGMDICFITTAKNDKEGYELLQALGMPFRKQ